MECMQVAMTTSISQQALSSAVYQLVDYHSLISLVAMDMPVGVSACMWLHVCVHVHVYNVR